MIRPVRKSKKGSKKHQFLRSNIKKNIYICDILFLALNNSELEDSKETRHLRKGKSQFWSFEDQKLQLLSVTNITGLTASIANRAS